MGVGYTGKSQSGSSLVPWELQSRFYRRANRSEMRRRVYWCRQVPLPELDLPPEPGTLIPE